MFQMPFDYWLVQSQNGEKCQRRHRGYNLARNAATFISALLIMWFCYERDELKVHTRQSSHQLCYSFMRSLQMGRGRDSSSGEE